MISEKDVISVKTVPFLVMITKSATYRWTVAKKLFNNIAQYQFDCNRRYRSL